MIVDYDEEETNLESLKTDSTDTRDHNNDDNEVDDDDDEKEDDANNDINDQNGDSEANPAQRKRSVYGIAIRASVGSSRRHRPHQRQRQRQRPTGFERLTGDRTSLAGVSLWPTTAGGRPRPTNAGRRKGLRYRWRVKPGRPSGGRERPRPAAALLADDAAAVHSDDTSRPKLVQNETEWKSCEQLTCAEGRGTCVVEKNSAARCRCQLGAVGSLCERGPYTSNLKPIDTV